MLARLCARPAVRRDSSELAVRHAGQTADGRPELAVLGRWARRMMRSPGGHQSRMKAVRRIRLLCVCGAVGVISGCSQATTECTAAGCVDGVSLDGPSFRGEIDRPVTVRACVEGRCSEERTDSSQVAVAVPIPKDPRKREGLDHGRRRQRSSSAGKCRRWPGADNAPERPRLPAGVPLRARHEPERSARAKRGLSADQPRPLHPGGNGNGDGHRDWDPADAIPAAGCRRPGLASSRPERRHR